MTRARTEKAVTVTMGFSAMTIVCEQELATNRLGDHLQFNKSLKSLIMSKMDELDTLSFPITSDGDAAGTVVTVDVGVKR